jgi:hypothetical protein
MLARLDNDSSGTGSHWVAEAERGKDVMTSGGENVTASGPGQ